jgi:RNA polymerase sigma-70 factor (ECF subfamily)
MDVPTPKNSSIPGPDLMASVAKGDQKAFEQLYEQSSALLYALVMRIVGNQDEAAELLQEVYLEAWRKASNYDVTRGTPMAWLVTLARSRALDRIRALSSRGKGVTASLDDTPAAGLIATNSDALEMRAATERQALVGTAIKSLPLVQRQAIELAFYDGLTHMEIAERLQTPLGTIKTRIRLGMEKLRDSLRSLREEELGIPE